MTLGTYPALGLAEARASWREARQDAQVGRDPAKARKRDKPAQDFETVAREWHQRDQAGNKSKDEVMRVLERELIPAWGHRAVADLGRRDILDLVDAIADRGAPTMARRVQAYIHRFFTWAVGRGIIDSNPATALPKPGNESKRDRVLIKKGETVPDPYEELRAVWLAAEELRWPFGPAVQLLILTGARRQQISALRWSEINGDTIELEGERTKNGEPHSIPLSAPAQAILKTLPRIGSSDLVFTTNGETPISGWSRAKAELDALAKIAPWRLHDLRRTVATGLQRLGVTLPATEAVLGHTSGSRAGLVGIYQRHDYASEKHAALESWGAHVMALVEGREPGKVVPLRGTR
jgi:integrase